MTEDESIEMESWIEAYLDTRNGDTSQRGKWAKEFTRIEQEIQGSPPSEKTLNKAMWYRIHDADLGLVKESEFVARIKKLQDRLKKGEDLTIGEETLARYFNYVEALYRNKGLDYVNAIRDHHHDIKGFKRVNFLVYNRRQDSKGVSTTLSKAKGI